MEISTGILLVGLGVAAIGLPLVTSLGVAFLVAYAFGAAGIVHLFRGIETHGFSSTALQAFVGVLYLVIAVAIVRHPLWSVASLALAVSATLVAEGVVGLAASFAIADTSGSFWLLLTAIVTLTLGFLAWDASILSSPVVVSALVGVNLMANGAGRVIAALDARRVSPA